MLRFEPPELALLRGVLPSICGHNQVGVYDVQTALVSYLSTAAVEARERVSRAIRLSHPVRNLRARQARLDRMINRIQEASLEELLQFLAKERLPVLVAPPPGRGKLTS